MHGKIKSLAVAVGLILAMSARPAEAGPLLSGAFSLSGNFLAVVSSTGEVTTLDEATGIDFLYLVGSYATPGVAGQFLVNSASGGFASFAGAVGNIQDFTFSGLGNTSFPNVPLLGFETVGPLTFDLLSIAVVVQNEDFLNLKGSGMFHLAGYDATPGTFTFSGNQADSTFSFSASEKVTVPEPASAVLFGLGVLVMGARRRLSR